MSTDTGEFMQPYFDVAAEILAQSPRMHPVMARSVIEFARLGAQLPAERAGAELRAAEAAPDTLLTTSEAAGRLRVSEKQIYRFVAQGSLRSYSFGRQHRFRSSDLETLLQQRSVGARAVNIARLAADERRAI